MTAQEIERFRRIEALFDGALELPAGPRRDAWLAREADPDLLAEVRRLLVDDDCVNTSFAPRVEELPTFGSWQAVRLLGRGGMGVVYLAERADGAFRMSAAVKVVPLALASQDIEERFRRERQFLASLDHPKIARLIDGGITAAGLPYLVMQYVEGLPIDRYCEERQLDARGRIALMRQVLEALTYVHDRQVIHRDLKASNILVDAEGNANLLDFGMARLVDASGDNAITRSGVFGFTPECASPEQIRGGPITFASDSYSAGVLLYRLLTGRPPFRLPDDPLTLADTIARSEPEPAGLGGPLDAILGKALQRNPADRYPSAREMDADLERYMEGREVRAREPRKLRGIALAAASVALCSIALWLVLHRTAAAAPPSIAVIPFAGGGYLSSGIASQITEDLARLKTLRVIAQSSAQQVLNESAGRALNVRRAGRRLNVTHLLTASVKQSAGRIDVVASLIRTSDGSAVWTNSYRRPIEYLSLIEAELQNSIAASLGIAQSAPGKRHVPQAQAHELYLKASFELNQATPATNELAQQDFRRALELDPDYAEAWERLGAAIWNRPAVADEKPKPDEARRALEYDQKALRLDPELPRAHNALGMYAMHYDWDWPRAEREFQSALAGQHGGAEHELSLLYLITGRRTEADEHQRRARDLDPIGNPSIFDAADFLFDEGRFAEARDRYRELVQQSPANPAWRHGLDVCELRLNPQEAIRRLRGIPRPAATDLQDLATAEALAGQRDEALRIISSLESRRDPDLGNMDFAAMYALAGDEARTVKYLDRAIDVHEVGVNLIHVYPDFARFQDTPEFHRLKKRIGLDW